MLSLEQIKQYYPVNQHVFERFMLREYLQCKILEIIFNSKYANQFAFLGGTALRLIYDNQRFSEDLDFDNFNISPDEFSGVSKVIKYKLDLEGYKVEIRNIEKGTYHCYIRFPGLLYNYGLSGQEEEKIFIRLDSEAQHFKFKPESFLLNKFDIFTEIKTTPGDILLAQKFYTIINRKRNIGRDFYDVVHLLGRKFLPNYDYLNEKLSVKNGAELKNKLLEKLKGVDMDEMTKDVRPFLINIEDEKKVLLFKNYIEQINF